MLLSLSILGIFLSVILLVFNARRYASSVFLGLFFFLISLYGLYNYVLVRSQSEFFVKIFLFLIPILGTSFYLIGPVLFWYVRSVITDNHRLRKSDLWHLLPAAIFILSALPGLFSPFSEKAEAAATIAQNADAIANYHPTLLSAWISYPALFLSRPLIILGYTCAAIIKLIGYLSKHSKSSVFSGQAFMTRWLVILLGSMFILVVSHILLLFDFTTGTFNLSFMLKTFRIISATALTGLLVSPFFFPGILYGLPRLPDAGKISGSTASEKEPQPSDTEIMSSGKTENTAQGIDHLTRDSKNNTSKFESDYLENIGEKTDQCMNDFKPYLQQDFNLAQLSVLVNTPVHHLAYYFREIRQMSFTDFRNRWRVNHAKNLILEGKFNDLTLEAIGLLSGFTSRNTFLNAFKKAEGISPNAFLSEIKKK